MILICVAVLCLAAAPSPPGNWIAIGLAVLALLATCLKWQPF